MEKLNELVELAEKADAVANLMDSVNPHTILAIAEAFRSLEQEKKAAEAKLAELEKQEPYGYVHKSIYESCGSCGLTNEHDKYYDSPSHIPLFTRAAPAVSLAELVPEERPVPPFKTHQAGLSIGFNDCRAAILRNIEEAK